MVRKKLEKDVVRFYREAIKETPNITDERIAARFGQNNITPKEVYEIRRKYGILTHEEELQLRRKRRNLVIGLSAAAVTLGAFTFYSLTRVKETKPPSYVHRPSPPKAIDKFNALPLEDQQRIITNIEDFVINDTEVGRIAKSIDEKVKLPEVEMPNMQSMSVEYSHFGNELWYRKPSNAEMIEAYLRGKSFSIGRAHEKLHYIQDISSQWDKLETFYKGRELKTDPNNPTKTLVYIPTQEMISFMNKQAGMSGLSDEEKLKRLQVMVNNYNTTENDRMLIREIQAYLSTEPYSSSELYTVFGREKYRQRIPELTWDKFNRVLMATIKLIVIFDDPIETAKFVGENGDNVDHYVASIQRITDSRNISEEFVVGKIAERYRKLRKDTEAIRYKTERAIDERYVLFRKQN